MEKRFVRLDLHGTEALDATHVLRTVHQAFSFGDFAWPVPIMLSRVTRFASSSSLQPSVCGGRIGTTKYLISAVESHTRMAVVSGSVTPKSCSTPRGSLTAFDRYGAALYHAGGSPRTGQG